MYNQGALIHYTYTHIV